MAFDSYDALWQWSTTELEAFWQSIWDYFELQSPTPHTAVLLRREMPGARWFPGAQVNYARQHAGTFCPPTRRACRPSSATTSKACAPAGTAR